jgi:hypothetical protein
VTEFKSFNLFLNRMAKKKTTQGIGYINNRSEFDNLVLSVTNVIVQEFNGTSHNATAINNVKRIIDNLVGRTRQNYHQNRCVSGFIFDILSNTERISR